MGRSRRKKLKSCDPFAPKRQVSTKLNENFPPIEDLEEQPIPAKLKRIIQLQDDMKKQNHKPKLKPKPKSNHKHPPTSINPGSKVETLDEYSIQTVEKPQMKKKRTKFFEKKRDHRRLIKDKLKEKKESKFDLKRPHIELHDTVLHPPKLSAPVRIK